MLEWNVYVEDINAGKIKSYNIFKHGSFYADLYRKIKDYKKAVKQAVKPAEHTRALEDLKTCVRPILMYYFWSKCEWEVVISSWPVFITPEELNHINKELEEHKSKWGSTPYKLNVSPDVSEKVDVYSQIMLNYNAFIEYIVGHLNEFKKPKTY